MDVCQPEIRDDIEYFRTFLISELQKECEVRGIPDHLVHEAQLVLEPKVDKDGALLCCYYFASAEHRSLFWLDGWDGSSIFSDCEGNLSLRHKGRHPIMFSRRVV